MDLRERLLAALTEPVEPMDPTAPAEVLIRVPWTTPTTNENALARTLELADMRDAVVCGLTTPAELKADLGIGGPVCGFRIDYPTGEPRFICLEPPHPERPTLHGGSGYSYDEAARVLHRGSHHEREI